MKVGAKLVVIPNQTLKFLLGISLLIEAIYIQALKLTSFGPMRTGFMLIYQTLNLLRRKKSTDGGIAYANFKADKFIHENSVHRPTHLQRTL